MKYVFLIIAAVVLVYAKLPTFENAKAYVAAQDKENDDFSQNYNDVKPLGYTKALLPFPANAGRENPVFSIGDLDERQIELRAEPIQKGATICVRDNDEGPDSCSSGAINQCYIASKATLKFEFYCTESCQSSDVDFYFRIITSPKGADDLWCSNRQTDGYPSDLIEGFRPDKKPAAPTIPPLIPEVDSSAFSILPSCIMMLVCLFATWLVKSI